MMGPVASKLLKEIRSARGRAVLDLSAFREARAHLSEPSPGVADGLPPDHAAWLDAIKLVATIGSAMLQAPALRKLALRIDAAEDEYMPGGPPQSPLLDSHFVTWWLCDASVGPRRETLAGIIAEIGPMLGIAALLRDRARTLAQSRLGVYRVTELDSSRVQLHALDNEDAVVAALPRDLKSRGELWLTRLLPPIVPGSSDWVVGTSPYQLALPDGEARWRRYLGRVVANSPATERARRLAQHFKGSDEPKRWLEYIMNGYFGVSETGGIVLTGIPDEPKSLPHHPEYDPAIADDPTGTASPLERVRSRLRALAGESLPDPEEEHAAIRTVLRAPESPRLLEVDRIMRLAFRMYGQLDADGRSALDRLARYEHELAPEEREFVAALRAGWFSTFEIVHVRLDEGMEVRDVLRRRKLWISERAATRQVDLGDLLCGWILIQEERVTLEGAICHVPRMFAPAFEAAMRETRDWLEGKHRGLDFRHRAGLLSAFAVPMLEMMMAKMPPPKFVNAAGDALVYSAAHYRVEDRTRVVASLARHFEPGEDGSYLRIVDGNVVATLELDGEGLTVRCNSTERLAQARSMLEALLDTALTHRLDSHEDAQARWKGWAAQPSAPPAAPVEIPAAVQDEVRQRMLEHMRAWIDQPIDALGGKTPRQAVRNQRGRESVALLLTRQQRIFASAPGMPDVDLSEIWRSLGLQNPA